jgi:peptide/nickel transport system substrate-binding protein
MIALSLAVALLGVAMGSPPPSTVVVLDDLPSTLDPLHARTEADFRAQALIYDRLAHHLPGACCPTSRVLEEPLFEPVPSRPGDPATVRVRVRDGLRWHDGLPVTAEDVCFTVQAHLDPEATSPEARTARRIAAGCVVDGPREARIALRGSDPSLAYRLWLPLVAAHRPPGPVGTGPMTVARQGEDLHFRRAPGSRGSISELVLKRAPPPDDAIAALRSGEAHAALALPLGHPVPRDLLARQVHRRTWWYLAFDARHGPLADARVRRALDLLVDRDAMRVRLLEDDRSSALEVQRGPFVAESPCHDRAARPAAPDPVAARDLLAEAGHPALRLDLQVPPELERALPGVGEALRAQLAAGGVEVALVGPGAAASLRLGAWHAGFDDDVGALLGTPGSGLGERSPFGFGTAELDARLRRHDDPNACLEAYAIALREVPMLFLWRVEGRSAWRPEVRARLTAWDLYRDFERWELDAPPPKNPRGRP